MEFKVFVLIAVVVAGIIVGGVVVVTSPPSSPPLSDLEPDVPVIPIATP